MGEPETSKTRIANVEGNELLNCNNEGETTAEPMGETDTTTVTEESGWKEADNATSVD